MLSYFLQIPEEIVIDNLKKVFLKKSEETFLSNKEIFDKIVNELSFEKSNIQIKKI
jgi:hypothetical protein